MTYHRQDDFAHRLDLPSGRRDQCRGRKRERLLVSKPRIVLIASILIILLVLILAGGTAWYAGLHDRGVCYDFDPAFVAAAETRMWRYYYAGRGREMGMEMIALMRAQFGISLKTAYDVVEPMARGAMGFHFGQDYRRQILPKLEESCARLAQACGKDWDAKALAEAELAWWVARRTPGEDSPEHVGELIATLYSGLYGSTNPDIERAGLLRAQAAALRDEAGQNADWAGVEALLTDSYTALRKGIQPGR